MYTGVSIPSVGGENSRDDDEYKKVRCLSLSLYVAIGASDEYISLYKIENRNNNDRTPNVGGL